MPDSENHITQRPATSDGIVWELVASFLESVDQEIPNLIEGLYLTGSVALLDFRPHESDIDFVAVTASRPDANALEALKRVHNQLQTQYPRPPFEGVYVTWDDLRRDPDLAKPAPSWHEGELRSDGFALDPVTWHTLARHGVSVRGPAPMSLDIWTDHEALASWTLNNLDTYWRPWHDRFSRPLSREGMAALGTWAPAWCVLGVSRLYYTLATGEITSKERAGLYALEVFPSQWHRIIKECLRIRRGGNGHSLYTTPIDRRRDALAFLDMVIDDAKGLGLD